jgi:hypothetical protein
MKPKIDPVTSAHAESHGGKFLKRTEAARMLGVSVSTLRRREGELLQPIVDTDGVHRFAESEVRSVMVTVRHRQTMTAMGPNAGQVARKARA